MAEKTKEWQGLENILSKTTKEVKHLWSVPIGMAGLLFWVAALSIALKPEYGAVICFGFGLIFVFKAKKQLKAMEVKK